jgi:hypothetical protein
MINVSDLAAFCLAEGRPVGGMARAEFAARTLARRALH